MSPLLRARRISGLLALAALLLSHGEAVAASTCAAMELLEAETAPVSTGRVTQDGTERPSSLGASGNDQSSCPFTHVTGPGCTGPPSLGSSISVLPAPPTEAYQGCGATLRRPLSRPSDGLFHPPKD